MVCFDNTEGNIYRPPSEADSFILRLTIGCSHNQCVFCSMYKDVSFKIQTPAAIMAQINQAASYFPDLHRVFLADGNALMLPTPNLLEILDRLKATFPKLNRVTSYGSPRDLLNKTPEELELLAKSGLKMIYMGIESGDDRVLSLMNKGVTATEIIIAGEKVIKAGIKLSAMIILGLGGKELTKTHAINTGRIVGEISPERLGILTLMREEGTLLERLIGEGKFTPLTPLATILELEQMITEMNVRKPCIVRSNHVSNLLPLAGTLPRNKGELLQQVRQVIGVLNKREI
ncbi:MAG: radical SAM protein [Desulfitibacter sp. BRH_c19]|nr:MAG: radical SAM protein [Desulfitibacter sp. BRH_c19]